MDTAVIETPGTAAAPEAPPPEDVESSLPETASEGLAPETEGEAETPETGDTESPWAGKTPEEIDAEVQKRIKDIEARKDESFRRQRENEQRAANDRAVAQQAQHQRTQAAQVRQGAAYRTLAQVTAGILKKAFDEGKENPDPELLGNSLNLVAGQVSQALQREHLDALWQNGVEEFTGRGRYAGVVTEIDEDIRAQVTTAFNSGDLRAAFAAHNAMIRAAERVLLRKQAAADVASAAAKPATPARQTRPAAVSPTRVGGLPGQGRGPDAVLATATPGSPEYNRAFREKHGIDP